MITKLIPNILKKKICLKDDDNYSIKHIFETGNLDMYLKNYLGYFDKADFIHSGFDWNETKEGYEFWKTLSIEWQFLSRNNLDMNVYFGFGIDYNLGKNNTKKI